MRENIELSLRELFNKLNQQQSVYGEKLERLYDIFGGVQPFPTNVSNNNDSPGLWPDTGVNVYAILPEYTLAVKFCTSGVLFNIGQGRYKYQMMLVQSDELRPVKNGKMYYRYAKIGDNNWSKWIRFLYVYELTGGYDENGERILDDFGLPLTDTEDMEPENNPHNRKYSIYVDAANHADKLTYPRKIELTGLVQGETMFDGSDDVKINVTSPEFYVPLNVRLNAGYRTYDEYHLLCELPATANSYNYVILTGHIGGQENAHGKCWFTACVSGIGGNVKANGFYVGDLGTNNIVVYRTVLNTTKVYLKLKDWNDDCKISVYGSIQADIKHEVESLPKGATLRWNLKDCPHIFEENVYGTFRGNADTATLSDRVKVVPVVPRTNSPKDVFIVGAEQANAEQVLKSDKNVKIKNDSTVVAPNFEGNLHGVADNSKESENANHVKVVNNQTHKAYILGTTAIASDNYQAVNSQPIYDKGIYLSGKGGDLYAKRIHNQILKSDDSRIKNLTIVKDFQVPKSYTDDETYETTSPSMHCLSDKQYFQTIKMGKNENDSDKSVLYMRRGELVFGDFTYCSHQVVFNFNAGIGGVYPDPAKDACGCLNIAGSLNPNRVYNAVYNDIAELFPCTIEAEVGDVLMLDLNADHETYIKSCEGAKCVAGVISDTYGYLLGGDKNATGEENAKKYKPIGMAGRVKVNVVGKVELGDKLIATDNGCARAYNKETDDIDLVIGYAVTVDNTTTEKRQIKMKIK